MNQSDSLSLLETGVDVQLKVSLMLFFAWDQMLTFLCDFILSRRLLLISILDVICKWMLVKTLAIIGEILV